MHLLLPGVVAHHYYYYHYYCYYYYYYHYYHQALRECFDAVVISLEVLQAHALLAIAYAFRGESNIISDTPSACPCTYTTTSNTAINREVSPTTYPSRPLS